MSIALHRLLAGLALAVALPGVAAAPSVEHEAAALFGLEYEDMPAGGPIRPGTLSCVEVESRVLESGGAIQNEWRAASAQCAGRPVELLKRRLPAQDGAAPRWRIEDVLLLPAGTAGGGRYLARPGECALKEAQQSAFVALLRRRGGRAPAVEELWTYDLGQARLQRQPAAMLECKAPED